MELAHKLIRKLRAYGTLVMFSHTIFSLSFGAVAFLAASNGRPRLWTAAWAALAFLSARTGANALNRAVDAKIDAKNPRTAGRQIPRGEISVRETVALSAACFALLVVSAAMLNPLCLVLSPLALLMMAFYSYTKRFTWLCHLFGRDLRHRAGRRVARCDGAVFPAAAAARRGQLPVDRRLRRHLRLPGL